MDKSADRDVTVEFSYPSIGQEESAAKPPVAQQRVAQQRVAKPKPNSTKTAAGFRDLLAQLRHNSSLIVRDTY